MAGVGVCVYVPLSCRGLFGNVCQRLSTFMTRSSTMELLYLWVILLTLVTLGVQSVPVRIQYTREFLLGLQWMQQQTVDFRVDYLLSQKSSPPTAIIDQQARKFGHINGKTRKRGRRGGVCRRIRRQLQRNRLPLPSMLLANVQSIRNKLDELQANVHHAREFRDACVMAFTETWLTDRESDSSLELKGFGPPVRMDRDSSVTGRTQGGGVCLYINRRWCNNITV